MPSSSRHIMLVAGEASGDMHAAHVVRSLQALDPQLRFSGIGGPRLRETGMEVLVGSEELAVMGVVEVLAHFPRLYGILRRMRRQLVAHRPDLLILVDYPGFNLRLARTAKELGIKVLYYISPQVWAWRPQRIHRIGRCVDHMAVIFPFELPYYQAAGIPATYVGHPLVDKVSSDLSPVQAREALGLDPARPVLGLFPGSRLSEITRLLPLLLDAAEQLQTHIPGVQFLLPLAPTLKRADLDAFITDRAPPVSIVEGRGYDVMRACDAIVTASGTTTLEIAIMGVPMCVIYRLAPMSYALLSRLITIKHIALCNIVADRQIAVELIQQSATAAAIAAEAQRLLQDTEYAARQRQALHDVREKLGAGGGAEKVARLALEMLGT